MKGYVGWFPNLGHGDFDEMTFWRKQRLRAPRSNLHFVTMPVGIVFISLAVFLVPGRLVRAIAERLVLGQAAHANPDGLLLWFDFKRSAIRLQNFSHGKR